MLGRTIFAATFFALAQFTVATPPGCLLGAVNQYEDPVDIQAVCKAKDLSSKVADICGDDTKAAMSALAEICNDADVEISTAVSSASGSKTATASGSSHKPTGTSGSTLAALYPTGSSGNGGSNGTVSAATGGPKPSGSATGTAGIPESTGAAGKVEFGVAALVAGFMVAAL